VAADRAFCGSHFGFDHIGRDAKAQECAPPLVEHVFYVFIGAPMGLRSAPGLAADVADAPSVRENYSGSAQT
jgi:hypothetical protein